jgi:hypothetical protein
MQSPCLGNELKGYFYSNLGGILSLNQFSRLTTPWDQHLNSRSQVVPLVWGDSCPAHGCCLPPGTLPSREQLARASTYAGLSQLNQRQVGFITIRRRGSGMLAGVERLPSASWQH